VGAIEDHTKALAIDPNDGIVYQGRGRCYLLSGTFDKAVADFIKAIDLTPGIGVLHSDRGWAQYHAGRFKDAVADFQKCIELDAESEESFVLWIWLARTKDGEREAATASLKAFFKDRPKSDAFQARTASMLTGDLAEKDFLDAAGKKAGPASFYVGQRRLLQNDPKGAAEMFKACVEKTDSTSAAYTNALVELSRLSGK